MDKIRLTLKGAGGASRCIHIAFSSLSLPPHPVCYDQTGFITSEIHSFWLSLTQRL